MSDDALDRLKQRLGLLLRAERAMGGLGLPVSLSGAAVVAPAAPVERVAPVAPVAPIEPAASTQASPGAAPPAPKATPPATAAPVLFAGADEPAAGVALGPHRAPFDSPPQPRERKLALLQAMDQDEVKGCPKCDLCKTRTNTVFGEGDPDARLMFIGEGPGENEDLQGRPFVGRSGELLDKMIGGMGLKREQVFIANIVKCRPPGNRVPAPDEVATCTPYLERQIEIIRPSVLVTLGLPASQYMLQTKLAMSKMRGQWHAWRGIQLMPTYHPAYVLRNYTEQTRAAVWSDLQRVMEALGITPKRKPNASS